MTNLQTEEEPPAQRIERILRTGLIRDAKDLEAWLSLPPYKPEDDDADYWQSLYDAAASFD